MLIALTGTPGTGKTTVSHLLTEQGITTYSLNELALSHHFTQGIDVKRGSYILDMEKINEYINNEYDETTEPILIEGHASHWLTSVSWVIILRCHPKILRRRLKTKRWNEKKLQENVEAEILDIILCEATEIHHSHNLLEIDTTSQTPAVIAGIILAQIHTGFSNISEYCIGRVDWSEELLKDPE
jgi:adenylate kinase